MAHPEADANVAQAHGGVKASVYVDEGTVYLSEVGSDRSAPVDATIRVAEVADETGENVTVGDITIKPYGDGDIRLEHASGDYGQITHIGSLKKAAHMAE